MPGLELSLFGTFVGGSAGNNLRLPTDKTRALLAYLALSPGTPHRRESLAGLFWPDQAEEMARQNLRKTLARLKDALGALDPTLPDHLLVLTKQTIEFASAGGTVDVLVFRQHLETARKHGHESLAQCATCLAGLEAAAGLYRRGELLAGLSLPDAAPFEEWLVIQRENLYQQQLGALAHLADVYEQKEEYEKARQYARWQIEQEPWREDAHRQLMRLYAAQGQRAEAIAQYQACRRTLQAELGVEPSPETEALLSDIMAGSLPVTTARAVAARPQALPRLAGPLIGRGEAIDRIRNLLAEPECRVLTISGLGGIGKTSLAVAVGEQLQQAPPPWLANGVYFVPAAPLTQASQLPAAVAEALGLDLSQRQDIARQVELSLRPLSLLLIIDNYEHLAAEDTWLKRLTQTAPHLKLLITAREPLNWQNEWRYPLGGLPYPRAEADGQAFEAVQLFVRAARQVQPGFEYSAENGPAIARICRLVQGWPLALQMAGAWVRMMACDAIANQIAGGLDLLTQASRDAPSRQRSIRVIFEHSWAALSEEESMVLGRLAVFRGGFTLAAAQDIAAASALVLAGLVDKSLVRHDAQDQRYTLHELLRQLALEKAEAQADTHRAAQAAHGRYYLELLNQQGPRLQTVEYRAAQAVIRADMENVRQAWLWALAGEQYDLLQRSLGHVVRYFETLAMPQEATTFFHQTLAGLGDSREGEAATLRAALHLSLAEGLLNIGKYAEATAAASAGLVIAQQLGDVALTNRLYIATANIHREQGHYAETHHILGEAFAYAEAHGDRYGMARTLHTRGNTYWYTTEYDLAMHCYVEGRDLYAALGQELLVAVMTGNVGVVLWKLGDHQGALEKYAIALSAYQAAGDPLRESIWLGNIGLVYVDLHQDELALEYMDEALSLHDLLGRKFLKIEILFGKVEVAIRRGDLAAAEQFHKEAVELSYNIGNRTFLLDCDLWQARVFVAQGRLAEAAALLRSLQLREFRPAVVELVGQELARLETT